MHLFCVIAAKNEKKKNQIIIYLSHGSDCKEDSFKR